MILRVCIVCERVEKASVIRVWVHAFLEFAQLIHDMVLGDGKGSRCVWRHFTSLPALDVC